MKPTLDSLRERLAARDKRIKAMLLRQAEALDVIEPAMLEDPASMDRILTEAQEGLAKFIEEEFPS